MSGKKILIVEDDTEVLELLKTQFEMDGYTVVFAQDGLKGLEKARTEMPDVIVLDLNLPLMDGYKVCRRLKSDDKYRTIPVLMLTGLTDKDDKLMGFESNADDYETKPFDPKMISKKVLALLQKKEESSS
jgi:two-component system alkaline phosphatase synthesis response regulator PhoP